MLFLVLVLCCSGGCLLCMLFYLHDLIPLIDSCTKDEVRGDVLRPQHKSYNHIIVAVGGAFKEVLDEDAQTNSNGTFILTGTF